MELTADRPMAGSGKVTPRDRILGWVGAAFVLAALVLTLSSLITGEDGTAPPPIAGISISSGESGALLEFEAPPGFGPQTGGWGVDGYHLHAVVGSTEIMPASSAIERAGGDRYRWSLPELRSAGTDLRLRWSDAAHRPIPATTTSPVDLP